MMSNMELYDILFLQEYNLEKVNCVKYINGFNPFPTIILFEFNFSFNSLIPLELV